MNKKKSLLNLRFLLAILTLFFMIGCSMDQNLSGDNDKKDKKDDKKTVSNIEDNTEEHEQYLKEVLEYSDEDIALYRKIQEEVGADFPAIRRTIEKAPTKGTNPGINAIKAAAKDVAKEFTIPYEIIIGIISSESDFRQFRSNGKPFISPDGGIGLTQITPDHVDMKKLGISEYDLKWNYKANIRAGAKLLETKWRFLKGKKTFIGNMDKKVLEHWYFAVMAYNGLSRINNPNEYNNGPRKWWYNNNTAYYTKEHEYQKRVYLRVKKFFNITITPISKKNFPRAGTSSRTMRNSYIYNHSFNTPQPSHVTGVNIPDNPDVPDDNVKLPLLKVGSKGANVIALQYLLNGYGIKCGVDGKFGPNTKKAVMTFQRWKKLSIDGKVGKNTWNTLFVTIKKGEEGNIVKALQILLRVKFELPVTADGIFGNRTKDAVIMFQRKRGLSQDGIAGPKTWTHLVGTEMI